MSGPGRPPSVRLTPAPAAKTMHVTVWDVPGLGAHVDEALLQLDDARPAYRGVVSDSDKAQVLFTLADDVPVQPTADGAWHSTLTLKARNGASFRFDVPVVANYDVLLPNPRVDMPALVVRGKVFIRANGERWTGVGASCFLLYATLLNLGPDAAEAVIADYASCGFNLLRLFMLNTSVGRIVPSDYGDAYYERLPELTQLAAKHDCYLLLAATTQAATLMPDPGARQNHFDRLADALKNETNWLGSYGNELNNADNGLNPLPKKPAHGLWNSGSFTGDPGDVGLPRPVLDFGEIHSFSASGEFQRVVGKQAAESADIDNVAYGASENARYTDMEHSVDKAYDAAAGAALLSAYSMFHSWNGKLAQVFDQDTRPAAMAWAQGARSVPLEFQDGAYVHRQDLETKGVLRVYGKRLPDGREYDVVIRS